MSVITVELRVVYCGNPHCSFYRKSGKLRVVGEASAGAVVRLKCESCKDLRTYQVA
jgi:hypothetical protein